MKDIKAILNENAKDLTDEQVKAISDAVGENYRSIVEMEKKTTRISELEEQNKTLSEQVEGLKGDGEELESLRKTVEDYKAAEEDRKNKEAEQQKRDSFRVLFDKAVGENEFANDLIRETVFEKAYNECKDNAAINASDALEKYTKDVDGIFKNPQHDPAKMPKADDIKGKKNSADDVKKSFAAQLFSSNKGV